MIAALLAATVLFGVFIPWAYAMDNIVPPGPEDEQ